MRKRGRERVMYRCDDCPTPIFEIDGDCLIFRNKHWGKRHVTVVRIADLVQEARKDEEARETLRSEPQ